MFATMKFYPGEVKPQIIKYPTHDRSFKMEIESNGVFKTITVMPTIWEYNRLFFTVAKYSQGICGILTLQVTEISSIHPL